MEMEYRDPSRRGRWIIVLGLVLAIGAGGGAFYLVNNAQKAGPQTAPTVSAVVAIRDIPARARITADDVALRSDVPKDSTTASTMLIANVNDAIGQTTGVSVIAGQLVTRNLFVAATTANGTAFSILGPGETVGPDSEAWRAISLTVADDRAVGGILAPGMKVDVIMTVAVTVAPPSAAPVGSATPGPTASAFAFTSGSSTKVTYQAMEILARQGTFYVMKATLRDAEEITHMQASSSAQFTFLLRPDQDARVLDLSLLGETTSRIIQRYGILIPQPYPLGTAIPSQPPIAPITPPPSAAPSGSPDASANPAPSAAPPTTAPGG
jgi:Flp pilus assembly protein CpaB